MLTTTRWVASVAARSALFVALGVAPSKASAGTMVVNTGAMTSAKDGKCSLVEALQALNTKATVNECSPGSGPVIITLPTNVGVLTISTGLKNIGITQPVTLQSAVANTKVTIRVDPAAFTSEAILINPTNNNTTVTLQDLTIDGTNAEVWSGIYGMGGGSGNKIVLNRCEVEFWKSGGIDVNGYTLNIDQSYIHDNGANNLGGVDVSDWPPNVGVFNISRSTIFNNSAPVGGGIIYDGTGHSTIVNSSILSNTASLGSAIATTQASAVIDITASTIAWNTATTSGAGQGPGTYNLTETLLANNTVSTSSGDLPSAWDRNSPIANVSNSLIDSMTSYSSDGTSGQISVTKSSGINVRNVAPGTNILSDVSYGIPDLGGSSLNNVPMSFLIAGSPAIDVLPSSTQATDQRGYPRGIGGHFDIGSFEYNPNAEAESMVPDGAPSHGAISHVSNVPGFTPASGEGIKFTPNTGLTTNANFVLRVPLILGAGEFIKISAQIGPASGTYQVSVRKQGDSIFTNVGQLALYGQSPFASTVDLPIPSSVQIQGYSTVDVQFALIGKDRRSSNNFLYLDSATFHH